MFKPVHAVSGGSLQAGIVGSDLTMTPDDNTYFAMVYALTLADHTYLKLGTGATAEIVKASNPVSGLLEIERAKDGTSARPWPAGTPIEYIFCSAAVSDMIAQNPLPTAITLTSADGSVTIEDEGGYTYDLSVVTTSVQPGDDTVEVESVIEGSNSIHYVTVNKAALVGCPGAASGGSDGG